MNLGQAWRALGISRTAEAGAIRRAYAARLKAMDVDQDVDAYARLREARDVALAWANQQAAGADPGFDPLPPELPEAPDAGAEAAALWPYAAPTIARDGPAALVTRLPADIERCDPWPVAGMVRRIADSGAPDVGPVFVAPLIAGQPDALGIVQSDRGRDAALYELLLGEDVGEDEPLDAWQEDRAREHLRAVLRQAAASDLTQQDNIEQWLAEILARAWPRSAPLLAPAAEAFGWEREAGQIGERPAMGFLVARLRGLRFHQRVLDPGHQFHKAWTELSRPGPGGIFKRLRASGDDVRQLLEGVRKHFPELEAHLDPQRVYSWESRSVGSSSGGGSWFPWWIVGIVGIQILAAIGRATGGDGGDVPAPPPALVSTDSSLEHDTRLLDETVAELFGDDMTFPALTQRHPELATTIRNNLQMSRSRGESDDAFRRRMANIVRDRIYEAGHAAGGADLVTAMRLRLAYLKELRTVGPDACMDLYRLRTFGMQGTLPPEVRAQERRHAAALLHDGRLVPPRPRAWDNAMVPGEIMERVRQVTGLPMKTIQQAMQNSGSDADRCAVTVALLAATLEWRGKEREAILRTL